MSVLLYDTSGTKDVCINAFLVMNGYCQSAGLGYDFFFHFFFVYPLFTDDKKRSKCFGVKREARNFGHVMMQFYD